MSDSESSLDSEIPADEILDWQNFIKMNRDSAAPKEAFNQPPSLPLNPFRKGHLLLAVDPKVPGCNVLARVEKTHKCWIRIRFLELERKTWIICDSDEIKPFDERNLHRHPDNPKSHASFYKFVTKTMDGQSGNIAGKDLFHPLKSTSKPKKNLFAVGMVVAWFDDVNFTGMLNPATVVAVNGDSVRLQIAGRRQSHLSEISLPFSDRSIFPIDYLHKGDAFPSPTPTKTKSPTPTSSSSIHKVITRSQTRCSAGMEKRLLERTRQCRSIPTPSQKATSIDERLGGGEGSLKGKASSRRPTKAMSRKPATVKLMDGVNEGRSLQGKAPSRRSARTASRKPVIVKSSSGGQEGGSLKRKAPSRRPTKAASRKPTIDKSLGGCSKEDAFPQTARRRLPMTTSSGDTTVTQPLGGVQEGSVQDSARPLLVETSSPDIAPIKNLGGLLEEQQKKEETQKNEEEKAQPMDASETRRTEATGSAGCSSSGATGTAGVQYQLLTQYSPFNIPLLSPYKGLNWTPDRQAELLKRAAKQLAASAVPRQVANRFMGINFPNRPPPKDDDMCVVHFDSSANVGPLLDPERVKQMPLHLTRMHYVQQVHKVAQFLVYCGKNQQSVVDAICKYDGGAEGFLEIYIRDQEDLRVHHIPKPPTFDRARYLIHLFLQHLNADRNLIDLVKSDGASSSGQNIPG